MTNDLDHILQSARAVLWKATVDPLRFSYISPEAEALFGIRVQDWYDDVQGWVRSIHPEDRDWAVNHCQTAASQGEDHRFEYRVVRPDGKVVWIEDIVKMNRGPQGWEMVGVMVDISARREAEEKREVQATELTRLLQRVWDNAHEGVVVKLLDGSILHANMAAGRLLGYEPKELVGMNFVEDLLQPEFRECARKNLRRLIETGVHEALNVPVRRDYRRKDGSILRAEAVFTYIAQAEPRAVAVFFNDAEARDKARVTAQASLDLFKTIVNNSVGLMGLFDPQGHVTYLSPSVKTILGYDVEELMGRVGGELLHPDDVATASEDFRRLFAGETDAVEGVRRLKTKDGGYRRLKVRYVRLGPGSPVQGTLLHAEDVEAALQAEEQLRDSETLHRSIVENSWDLLAVVGPDARIEQASPSMVVAFGAPIESLIGKGVALLAVPDDRPRLVLMLSQAFSKKPGERDQDIRLQLPHGPNLFEVRLRHLGEDREGRVLFKARDVQNERESQAQILQYQRLAVFGQLAAGFAHEVRNPLAGILSAAQLAQRRAQTGQDVAEQLQVVLRQSERLRALMEDILQHAKGPRLAPSLVDPSFAMEKAAETALQQFGPGREKVQVEFSTQAGNARVQVTEERLLRLLHNLVLNALQALPAAGGRLQLGVELKGGEVRLSVEDNGPGLSEDAALRAFEPFYTTKPTGSGLGLWIAQSLCQEMGGRLEHRPVEPHGAAFSLTLPVA